MEDEKKRLLETFQKLDPENRVNVLSHAMTYFIAQENTKKRMLALLSGSNVPEVPAQRRLPSMPKEVINA